MTVPATSFEGGDVPSIAPDDVGWFGPEEPGIVFETGIVALLADFHEDNLGLVGDVLVVGCKVVTPVPPGVDWVNFNDPGGEFVPEGLELDKEFEELVGEREEVLPIRGESPGKNPKSRIGSVTRQRRLQTR